MSVLKKHIYLMPGMASNPMSFKNLKFDTDIFHVHYMEWILPEVSDSLETYCQKLILKIEHQNPILIGVSFGGIIVQEISKCIPVERLIIISSVKTKYEFPWHFRMAQMTGVHKLLPTGLIKNFDLLYRLAYKKSMSKRLDLIKYYLSVNDKIYLDWAIDKMLNWSQVDPIPGIIHIHGTSDKVFPIFCISDCIRVAHATHILILNRHEWLNENLPKLILKND
jgi:hypothetical protein